MPSMRDSFRLAHFYYDADYWELFNQQKDPEKLRVELKDNQSRDTDHVRRATQQTNYNR